MQDLASPLLSFHKMRKRYGKRVILEIDDLAIPSGVHMLLGANGSGKTTLLRSLAGIIPFEGDMVLEGKVSLQTDKRQHRLQVSYAEAEPVLPDFLPGMQLVEVFSRLKKAPQGQLETLCQQLQIGDYLPQKIGSYSTGMKKKLALLLAFLGDPRLILLDEPFNGLDPHAQTALVELIAQQRKAGRHFLLATHHPPAAWQQLTLDGYWHINTPTLSRIEATEAQAWIFPEQNEAAIFSPQEEGSHES